MCNELIEQFDETIGPPLEYLTKLRWPEGFVCPIPGCDGVLGWQRFRGGRELNICPRCRRQVSVTAGTCFAGKRNLRNWLLGGWLIVSQNKCVDPAKLQQWLQVGKGGPRSMVRLYRGLMSELAPEMLELLVDCKSIGRCGFWRPYEFDPDRPKGNDVTAWIQSGWLRNLSAGHNHSPKDMNPCIRELLFKYEHRDEPLSERFKLVIRQALKPPTDTAGSKQPLFTPFNLPTPKSPDEETELFGDQKQRIDNMMSLTEFSEAEKLAQALLAVIPSNTDAEAILETVRRESSAFRVEQQTRLFAEFQRWTESRQWIKARTVGEQLIGKYPASDEGLKVAAAMSTVEKNAHFEEVRTLLDRIREMIKRKRYYEAVKVAEDLINRFPNTQVAKQLRSRLSDLKRKSDLSR